MAWHIAAMLSALKTAARAAIFRTTPEPRFAGLGSVVAWAAVLAAVRIALQYVMAGPAPGFAPYGLNAVVTRLAVALAVAAFFVRPQFRTTFLSAMLAFSVIFDLVLSGAVFALSFAAPAIAALPGWQGNAVAVAFFVLQAGWWLGAMYCVLLSLQPEPRFRALARAACLGVAIYAANMLVPHAPVFAGANFDIRGANWWEYVRAQYLNGWEAARNTRVSTEIARIEQSQPALLQAAAAQLAPRVAGATNVYAIGVAGWADQDVFIRELDGGLASLGAVLPIKDRTLRLINHQQTAASVAMANRQNLAAAVAAAGKLMDKKDDVLVLFMTSHGTQSGFGLQLPERTDELKPQDVVAILDKEGIKNRLVIVSACYSGIFVKPLANDDTIVLTAADENNTSFGCSTEREWTYFGDALFAQSLRPGVDFRSAFAKAKTLIDGWEAMDRAAPSNPQGHFGAALVKKLEPVLASMSRATQ